jgi:hypothetical protein
MPATKPAVLAEVFCNKSLKYCYKMTSTALFPKNKLFIQCHTTNICLMMSLSRHKQKQNLS